MTIDISPVRPNEQMDWLKLENWLNNNVVGLEGDMQVAQFHGGHANLTYCVTFGEQDLVVRRPPFGTIAPGAHDMTREYRVLSGLSKALKQAPQAIAFCSDDSVIGANFIVVERRKGLVIRDHIPKELRVHEGVEKRLSYALIDAMSELHSLEPKEIGLETLGRPEGFVARQLKGWKNRWELSYQGTMPLFLDVYQRLATQQPETKRSCIVHNDLKLDNCMFKANNPDKVDSIFDWDMATLGDPLIELGTLLSYWRNAGDSIARAPTIDLDMTQFPKRDELVKRYAGSGVNVDSIQWYEAFGLWKHAVVLQQLFQRYQSGQSTDLRYKNFSQNIDEALELASDLLC